MAPAQPDRAQEAVSVSISMPDTPNNLLLQRVIDKVRENAGWLPFDAFMAMALYEPGLGYYANNKRKIGHMASDGSDFVTAPELSRGFGVMTARQLQKWLQDTGVDEIWEFGAGRGTWAHDILKELDALGWGLQSGKLKRYCIVELSASLRDQQQQTLKAWGHGVAWQSQWPDELNALVIGNEVLDAMPVKLLHRVNEVWHERGVCLDASGLALDWYDRPTPLRLPIEPAGHHDYLTELHQHDVAWVKSLGERLRQGAVLLFDYGFPESEYFHPQRDMGTLMCHEAHQADPDPLLRVGHKDITSHVDFTAIALAAQEVGLGIVGYTSQGRFLLNMGLAQWLETQELPVRVMSAQLINEHEMGELFKVIALAPQAVAARLDPTGFEPGDRTHTL